MEKGRTKTLASRLHVRAEVEGKVFLHDQHRLFIAPLHNLSAGGVFVEKLTAIPLGAEVKLIIKSPHFGVPIQMEGKVVRVESDDRKGLAIQFINKDYNDEHLINQTVLNVRMKLAQKVLKNAA